ncbi:MAG: Ig-like domain-containing protein, partial [Candidatus Electryoneaceae bacterium]|nr:Ig-like domain-containing protein [Candidatus Electryoneaceae bacterium]
KRVMTLMPNQSRSATITGTLVDIDGRPVQGMQVDFHLDPPNMGNLDAEVGTTDNNGQVARVFTTLASDQPSYGTVYIVAKVGDLLEARVPIDLRPVASPVNIQITPPDTSMYIVGSQEASMTITAVVTNEGGVGVPATTVKFEMRPMYPDSGDTLFGSLTPRDTTDMNGQVQTVFSSRGGAGRMIIRAEVLPSGVDGDEDVEIAAEMKLYVERRHGNDTGALWLNADKDYIYADNAVTTATLMAILKDQENQALSNREIIFTSNNFGTVQSPKLTDSLGIASVTFRDIGMESEDRNGQHAPCMIIAKYDPMGLSDTVFIDIRPQEEVNNIVLSAGAQSMGAGSNDSTWVRASVFLDAERTQPAPLGTMVHFDVTAAMGIFSEQHVTVGGGGVAETNYITGNQPGFAVLTAFAVNEEAGEEGEDITITSNEVQIELVPGPPAFVLVQANPSVLQIGEIDEHADITAAVFDSVGNPIRDNTALVQFATTLGTVEPASTPTVNGIAQVLLRPGVVAGNAQVSATVDGVAGPISAQTSVRFISGGGSTIQLSASPLQIQVIGTGGNSVAEIRASVRDANGNMTEVATPVVFTILPEADMNGTSRLNNDMRKDTSMTSNGIARASLTAGEKTGPQLIRAYTLTADGEPTGVIATLSNVAVVAGPPNAVDIDVNDLGTDAGGGAWSVEVSARVFDTYQNPVTDSIPVMFTVREGIASVTAGYTGNEGTSGEPVRGLAYGTMTYNSEVTFDSVTVVAYCRTELVDSVGGELLHVLPLQEGNLQLHDDPINWMFERNSPDSCDVRVWAILVDGHQILIDNAPIHFTTSRARFFYIWRYVPSVAYRMFFPEPAIRFTGPENDGDVNERRVDDDARGHAEVWLRGYEQDFYLDPFTLEVTVQIEACVEGYDDVTSDPVFLFCTRH